jgi:hypothetical protein
MNQFRQGDVLLTRVERMPKGLTPVPLEAGRVVLAHGEVTGHAHAIDGEVAALFERSGIGGERYIDVKAPANLVHEEHGTVALEPGIYAVTRQREHDLAGEARRVAD